MPSSQARTQRKQRIQRGGVVKHHRGPLLFIEVDLGFGKAAFIRAVAEHHVLQFAFAAFVADRTIERMVAEEEFERAFAGLADLLGVRF